MRNFLTRILPLAAVFTLTFIVTFVAFAADVPNPMPSGLPMLGQVHGVLSGVAASSMLGSIGVVLEILFRAIPTKKPLSILWLVVGALGAVSAICDQVKSVLTDLIQIANRVLPAPEAPSPAPAPKAS